jgi:hypothetical protein
MYYYEILWRCTGRWEVDEASDLFNCRSVAKEYAERACYQKNRHNKHLTFKYVIHKQPSSEWRS